MAAPGTRAPAPPLAPASVPIESERTLERLANEAAVLDGQAAEQRSQAEQLLAEAQQQAEQLLAEARKKADGLVGWAAEYDRQAADLRRMAAAARVVPAEAADSRAGR